MNKTIERIIFWMLPIIVFSMLITKGVTFFMVNSNRFIFDIDHALFYLKTPLIFNDGNLNDLLPDYAFTLLSNSFLISIIPFLFAFFMTKHGFKLYLLFTIIILCKTIPYCLNNIKFGELKYFTSQFSDIYENEYVKPNIPQITTGEKRNLILIFLESLEITATSKNVGGAMNENYLPSLTNIALYRQNISFSEPSKLNGAHSLTGTTWSTGGIVAATSGITLKPLLFQNPFNKEEFLNNTVTIFDILHVNNYYQACLIGTYKEFGGEYDYFKIHKVNKILGAEEIRNNKLNYRHLFGIDDSILYDFSKKALLDLGNKNSPFALYLFPTDSHLPGFLPDNYKRKYKKRYSDTLLYTDEKLSDLLDWIRKQPFYNNTTIVLIGDHPLNDNMNYYDEIPDNYQRKVFFIIINASEKASKQELYHRREFSTLDAFPTILQALGFEGEIKKLGLGRNLFYNQKTLIEKYGLAELNLELKKRSRYYEKNLY